MLNYTPDDSAACLEYGWSFASQGEKVPDQLQTLRLIAVTRRMPHHAPGFQPELLSGYCAS
jgi:hypothetical protein